MSDWDRFKEGFGCRKSTDRDECKGALEALRRLEEVVSGLESAVGEDERAAAQVMLDGYHERLTAADAGLKKATSSSARRPFKQQLTTLEAEVKGTLATARDRLRGMVGDPDSGLDLSESPMGRAALDRMVLEEINWKKPTAEDRAFAKKAMAKRFNIVVTDDGEWGRKTLRRIYALMAKLPDGHTVNNAAFKDITRDASGALSGLESSGSVTLRFPKRMNRLRDHRSTLVQDRDVEPSCRLPHKKTRTMNHVTVHEVGHTVDGKLGFMDAHKAELRFGGWSDKLGPEALAERIGDTNLGGGSFFTAFANTDGAATPRAALARFLATVLVGGDPDKSFQAQKREATDAIIAPSKLLKCEPLLEAEALRVRYAEEGWPDEDTLGKTVQRLRAACGKALKDARAANASRVVLLRVLNPLDPRPLADAVAAETEPNPIASMDAGASKAWHGHPAVAFCKKVCALTEKGPSFVKGRSAADELRFGDDVVAIDTNQKWYVYAFAARRQMISNFQFNAPAEWFAELYAAYHEGLLPESHPHFTTMKELEAR